jgi:hypothetical protein
MYWNPFFPMMAAAAIHNNSGRPIERKPAMTVFQALESAEAVTRGMKTGHMSPNTKKPIPT